MSIGLGLGLRFRLRLRLSNSVRLRLGIDLCRRLRLILQQILHILLIQFGSQRRSPQPRCGDAEHGRVMLLELTDLRDIFFAARQLALLLHECAVVTLARINLHQLQPQAIMLRLRSDGRLQQVGRMVQTAAGQALLDLSQQLGIRVLCR
ncbi:hypothetical protein D3C79_724680 [compost metagenome]